MFQRNWRRIRLPFEICLITTIITDMQLLKKMLILMAFYFGLAILDGCIVENDCNCPPLEKPFFDYSALRVQASSYSIPVAQGAFLELRIIPDSVELVAQQRRGRTPYLGLIGVAYACSCIPEGSQGDKFGIAEINVFADRSFRASIPVEQNLNALFKMETTDNQGNRVFKTLDEIGEIPGFGWQEAAKSIITEAVPEETGAEAPYRFTIEIVKTNGERVSVETEEVYWAP